MSIAMRLRAAAATGVLTIAFAIATAVPASAAQVFSNTTNFNNNNTYQLGNLIWAAAAFTPAWNTKLSDIQLVVSSSGDPFTAVADVYLMTDAGNKPGVQIEHLGSHAPVAGTPTLVQVLSSVNSPMQAGTQYWVAVSLRQPGTVNLLWRTGGSPDVPTAYCQGCQNSGPWQLELNSPQFVVNGTPPQQPFCVMDIDGNGKIEALNDGLMILRTMFGLTGQAVTNNAIGANAKRSSWSQVEPILSASNLDVDGNGRADALTDGLLILRAMFGLTGTAVTNGAVANGAPRSTWADIRAYMNGGCGTNFPQ